MYNRRYTPDRISELRENEIFVFGSNLAGAHGGGAARLAYERFGAIVGKGVGLQGQSYAIPTMQGGVATIIPYVSEFIRFARQHRELTFLVTRIGCGIAGFRDDEIAPLFKDALEDENIILPREFVNCLTRPNEDDYNLQRFIDAQKHGFELAVQEVQDGEKRSHWIWYIFPQLAILGRSTKAKYYGISGIDEAEAYLNHPILGERLRVISRVLLSQRDTPIVDIFGEKDTMKVRSCMTLFDAVSPHDVFEEVLRAFYGGNADSKTLQYM